MQGSAPQAAIGPYRLLGEISRGATSVVYRALSPAHDAVALKLVHARGDRQRARFKAELEAALRLEHPCLVRVRDAGEVEGRPYLVMDLVEGESLARRLERGPLRSGEAAELVRKLAGAVEHAHQAGLLHRDLTPNNVLIQPDGDPVLIDFGLVREVGSSEAGLTQAGATTGTPGFLPPEQAAGKRASIGVHSDVYGLGAVLYAALTGRPPIEGESWVEILAATCQQEPVAPCLLNPRIDSELEALCLRCLRKEPSERPQSAAEVGAALADYLDCSVEGVPAPGARRALGAGALGLVVALAGVVALTQLEREPETASGGTPSPTPSSTPRASLSLDEVEQLLAGGERARAQAELERILEEAPSARALALSGRVARAEERRDEALRLARVALGLDPDCLPARMLQGELLVEQRAWGEAAQSLRRVVRQDPRQRRGWELLARVELEREQLPQALHAAERALGLAPTSVPATGVRFELALKLGRRDVARRTAKALLEAEASRARRLSWIHALALDREPARAGAELAGLLPLSEAEQAAALRLLVELGKQFDLPGSLDPGWLEGVAELSERLAPALSGRARVTAYVLRGHVLNARGEARRALDALALAAAVDPGASAMAGLFALQLGEAQRAEVLLAGGKEDLGVGAACRAGLSLIAAAQGDARAALEAAFADWEAVGKQSHAVEALRVMLGKPAVLGFTGEVAAAVLATPRLAEGAPLRPADARLLREYLLRAVKAPHDFAAAVAAFDEESPDLRLLPSLSPVLAKRRDLAEAERARRIAYEQAGSIARVLNDYLNVLHLRDPQRALEVARAANSKNPQQLRRRAVLEAAYGDDEAACALYRSFLERSPEDWALHNNLAFLLAETGRAEEALEHATLAASRDRNLQALDTLGWTLYRLERYPEAEERLREALSLGGPTDSPTLRLHLSATLLARGRREEARVQLGYAELILPVAEALFGRDLKRRQALLERLRQELAP